MASKPIAPQPRPQSLPDNPTEGVASSLEGVPQNKTSRSPAHAEQPSPAAVAPHLQSVAESKAQGQQVQGPQGRARHAQSGAPAGSTLRLHGAALQKEFDASLRGASSAKSTAPSTIKPSAIEALSKRIADPALAVSEEVQAAFARFVGGDSAGQMLQQLSTQREMGQAKALHSYLKKVGDENTTRLIRVNCFEMPGVENIAGNELYTLRGLALAVGESDMVVLPENTPQRSIDIINTYRGKAGLAVPKVISEEAF